MQEDLPSESLHEYCLKLGLQVREDNDSKEMAVATYPEDGNSSAQPCHTKLNDIPKRCFDCKNCGKSFANSRQFVKHKCLSSATQDSLIKPKRRAKRSAAGAKRNGKSKKNTETVITAESDLYDLGLAREAASKCASETRVGEETQSVVHEMNKHIVIHETKDKCSESDAALENDNVLLNRLVHHEEQCDGRVLKLEKEENTYAKVDLSGNATEALSNMSLDVNEINPLEEIEKNHIQCESCCMLSQADPSEPVLANKASQKLPCKKCKKLTASSSETCISQSFLDDEIISEKKSLSGKKRKYTFKKPEDLCPHCEKGFHSEKRLAKHVKVCGKNLVCEFCGEDFNTGGRNAYSKYEEHYYTHTNEKPYQCTVCTQGFVRKQDLNKHSVIHMAEHNPQKCLQCGVAFASPELLEKHKKKHGRPTWTCPNCNHQFVRQAKYERHILSCQKQVSCEVCGKVFQCLSKNIKYRYQEHMFIHTGEKPYKCQFCERAFRDRSTRKKHERSHTGERPYKCTMCERAFSQLRLLRNHVRTHTGEKPFQCDLCELRFAKQCNLKYHMRVHTKEKPYTCDLCQKSFTQSGTYYKHMRRHKSNQPSGQLSSTPVNNEIASKLLNPTPGTQQPTAKNINSVNLEVIQEIPMSGNEITIIVSEGNADSEGATSSLTTINVDQISSILASCT